MSELNDQVINSTETDGEEKSEALTPEVSEDNQSQTMSERTKELLEEVNGEPESQEEEETDSNEEDKAEEIEEKIQELKKKLKLKVDGQEIEEEIDWNDEDGLKAKLQKAKAFDKRSQELSLLRNQVQELVKGLRENPGSVLQQLGLNVDELAEQHLQQKIEELQKSPEQIEKEKMAKELEALRKEKEEAQKRAEEQEMERLKNEQANLIQQDILENLNASDSGLPNTPFVIKRIAQVMMLGMQNGYPDITAKDAIPIVKKQFREELNGMFGNSSEDLIEALVGKNNIDRIRKRRINKHKATKPIVKETGKKVEKTEDNDSEKVKYNDFFDFRT